MTPITLPRTVVEQALEALEWSWGGEPMGTLERDAITSLRAALAQQAEPVEPVAHRVVAGALFDFMGWLTSRRERLVLSSIDDAAPAADAIKDFAEMRGLSLDDAKVQDWNAAPPQQAEPVGTRALIEECLAAFAEELAAWDIDPPLHHVKQAHDKCEAWLAALAQQAEPVDTDCHTQGICQRSGYGIPKP